jgi:hypothetical protein
LETNRDRSFGAAVVVALCAVAVFSVAFLVSGVARL